MKKLKMILSLLIAIFLFSSVNVQAKSNFPHIIAKIDGKNQSVRKVSVQMNGKPIVSDVPSFIYKDRTLVPVRFVADNMGAKVKWDQKEKKVAISTDKKNIKLKINSNYVSINGKEQKLPYTPYPKLVNDSRTMVPLRFISETLGFKVGWDDKNGCAFINSKKEQNSTCSFIEKINVDESGKNIVKFLINSSNPIKYKTVTLQNPFRLVLDIPNTKLNIKDTSKYDKYGIVNIPFDRDPIKQISASQFSKNPYVTRVVFHLTEKTDWKINKSKDGKTIGVSFVCEESPLEDIENMNKVNGVDIENVNGKKAIVINTTKKSEFNVMELKNPNRIVVDVADSYLDVDKYNYDVNLGFIKKIRLGQFEPEGNNKLYNPKDKIARIVLDVREGIPDANIKVDSYENKIIIIPEKSVWEDINYCDDGEGKVLNIEAKERTKYSIDYDSNKKIMKIKVPSTAINLGEETLNIKDGLINNIKIEKDGLYKNVLISFRRRINYKVVSKDEDDNISIKLTRNKEVIPEDIFIILDAGHGGHDPGTSSASGVREKDVNIEVVLKLEKKLESLGYNTILTRDDDTFVNLHERANIANRNYADLFLSIHSNANDNKNISGIQVLYCPVAKSSIKQQDDYSFAQIIQEELLKTTGAVNKGIIQRPGLVVLRETKMPAVLAEVGFLSNVEETKLLTNDDYLEKIVDGIVKGIIRYLKEIGY